MALRQIQKMALQILRENHVPHENLVHESLHHEVLTLYTFHKVPHNRFDQIDSYSICNPSFLQNIYLSNIFYANVYILDGRILITNPMYQRAKVILNIYLGIWELAFCMLNRNPFCCCKCF